MQVIQRDIKYFYYEDLFLFFFPPLKLPPVRDGLENLRIQEKKKWRSKVWDCVHVYA